eukprot:CAMPEP_0113306346 /NCGR_PEP_ID=MMETSP0010_2-20120614/5630_1 /TAXON_ID=216773 ORGANISM="Corethron hystrix, Strain 308" /NCGR_SAMPLE_ID=MMETSP0010_2 /ASSEMBLY_ACC=CAM_ASM_000155 /LENGTH=968 /DNA_ID=CAMNT_0000160987 /DNA_START=69 /DNA_END=2972 /DNA_ORIENTATION=+ /assembly_acc=CAM_ASM_000155
MSEQKKEGDEKDSAMVTAWPMSRIRSTFIDYFTSHPSLPHTYYPSSPVVPHDDPTLLFANAGMNQYKPLFLGTCDPSSPLHGLKRAVNTQKCIRAGGKHNDLDDVGKDVYHHTFFEMMGNWSFGDYFKKEAIDMCYKCLVDIFGLDPSRLYATYFGGDDTTPADTDARDIWLKYLPASRVLPFDAADNFWEMGATGPCGPCVEVHYDRIGGRDAAARVNADLPDVIEIWNNVFIQYNREADGSLRDLPGQHVDTGMGFERLASILQGVDSNYDTDIFIPIFQEIQKITKCPKTYGGKLGDEDIGKVDMAYRVVADHIRTLSFAITDGAVPSNDGRGYVLRRILRRAVRYGRQNLGADLGFFANLVPIVIKIMGDAFPELVKRQDFVTKIIKEEEESFSKTLDKGLIKFQEMADAGNPKIFSGTDAHFLYTSMGFPVDLTELMAEERGMTLDRNGFEAKMEKEKLLSKEAHAAKTRTGSGKDMGLEAEQTSYLGKRSVKTTDDSLKYTWESNINSKVTALFLGRGETDDGAGFVEQVDNTNGSIGLVLDKTPFYAEQGGQVCDIGMISLADGSANVRINSVQVYGGFVLHVGEVVSGSIRLHDDIICHVDYDRRKLIAANHTTTHVLNYALRDVLIGKDNLLSAHEMDGKTVDQRGSLVDESKLRFDFSWGEPLSLQQIALVEAIVSKQIDAQLPVHSFVASLDAAKKIKSLRAVFGEVYPDPVRVVSISNESVPEILEDPTKENWLDYSIEFCGGTHLSNTAEAERFVLLNEEGIAKGVRRITGVTGSLAVEADATANAFMTKLEAVNNLKGQDLQQEVKQLKTELNSLSISAARKIKMRTQCEDLTKRVIAWMKEETANKTASVVEAALAAAASTTSDKAICRFDFGIDGKVAKAVMAAYGKKVKDKALLMITTDAAANRFMVFATAPKGVNVDCKKWLLHATEGTGAKGGGKKKIQLSSMAVGQIW